MSENPYEASATDANHFSCLDGSRDNLRRVAGLQQGVLTCFVLFYLVAQIFYLTGHIFSLVGHISMIDIKFLDPIFALTELLITLVGMAIAFALAVRVCGTVAGVLLGLLMLIPLIGLLGLVFVNLRATQLLRKNGIAVGFYGADVAGI